MAQSANQTRPGFAVLGLVSKVASSIWAGLIKMGEAQSRTRQIQFLQSLTDEELRQRGLTRDRIVHHVFADSAWI